MLLRHSAIYLLARGVPGILNFLAIAVYTRLLSPEEYGQYALVVAGVGLFNVVFFQWLRLALGRFFPSCMHDPESLLSTTLAAFILLVGVTGILGLLILVFWPGKSQGMIIIALLYLWTQAWFDLNLTLVTIKLQPKRYGLLMGLKAIISITLGILFVLWGFKGFGPLLGLLLGVTIVGVGLNRHVWSGLRPVLHSYISPMLRYGLPLTATFALSFIVSSSDRFIIAWYLDKSAAGVYSASYDLGQQTLTLLMMIVNLAAYPLAVRALEQNGVVQAQKQLKQNATLLLAVAIPSTVGFVLLAPNITTIFLGTSFHREAVSLLPWLALATLLSGVRAYHFDLSFQLGRHTLGQVWVVGTAAILNVVLNLWWIPRFGIVGAAYATLAAYMLALLMSIKLGRKVFSIPFPFLDMAKIILASIFMGIAQ